MPKTAKILTVLPTKAHRDEVDSVSGALATRVTVMHAPNVTGAVFSLLTKPADIILVDSSMAGDLLGALQWHARRSAPNAVLHIFDIGQGGDSSAPLADTTYLPWSKLGVALHDFKFPA